MYNCTSSTFLYRQHIHQLCLFRVYFLKLFKCLIEFFAIILPHCKDYYYNFSEDVVLSDLLKNKAVNKIEKRNLYTLLYPRKRARLEHKTTLAAYLI